MSKNVHFWEFVTIVIFFCKKKKKNFPVFLRTYFFGHNNKNTFLSILSKSVYFSRVFLKKKYRQTYHVLRPPNPVPWPQNVLDSMLPKSEYYHSKWPPKPYTLHRS